MTVFSMTFRSGNELVRQIKRTDAYLANTETTLEIKSKQVYVISLRLSRIWDLKTDYWDGNHMEYGDMRQDLFRKMLVEWDETNNPYQVLVTPNKNQKGKIVFLAPLPVSAVMADKDIEAFMQYSDWPVDINATTAALYSVARVTGIALDSNYKKTTHRL